MHIKLKLRRKLKRKKPIFLRQDWHRKDKLGFKWRRPRGWHSKVRRKYKQSQRMPEAGFSSPHSAFGLHPSGLKDVLIHNPAQVASLEKSKHAIRIASTVGRKKRIEIEKLAAQQGIRVINPRTKNEP